MCKVCLCVAVPMCETAGNAIHIQQNLLLLSQQYRVRRLIIAVCVELRHEIVQGNGDQD